MSFVFQRVIDTINRNFDFAPTAFGVVAGAADNPAGQNEGACRVLAFAKDMGLSAASTLALFAEHYKNVLDNPDADSHQNIRLVMRHGIDAVWFDKMPLSRKATFDEKEVAELIADAESFLNSLAN